MRVSGKKGFTLIELLIVVVIIGILAAIAIPKFANTKEKAYVASMKSDLRNLATAEESYFADYQTYSNDKVAMKYNESSGVSVNIPAATGTGWSAVASHNATTRTCWVGFGTAAQSTSLDGVISCT